MASKWAHEIAARFLIDDTQAADFLYSVQRRCLPNIPRYPVIVENILRNGYTTLPDPELIAGEIKSILPNKPKVPKPQNKSHKKHKSHFQSSAHDRQMLGYSKLSDLERPAPSGLEPGVEKYSYFDRTRLSPEKMDHCIHGVPKGKLCAICNPEEFNRMNGIE